MTKRPTIAYVIDPRFPGGTSSALASELEVTARMAQTQVFAISSKMFSGAQVAPVLQSALDKLRIPIIWDPDTISADLVILHNPAFLKFQSQLQSRIIAQHLVVVTHENFLRPKGAEAFDVRACLDLIDGASLALRKTLAPVSPYNRIQIERWFKSRDTKGAWDLMVKDWFNVFAGPPSPPTETPRDRRGRHSRAGFEKFPSLADMDLCFPAHAECNVILGADLYIKDGLYRPHWTMVPFRGLGIGDYFDQIDFMIYFTAPTLRESFGRVLLEAVAAGKVVISDADTASGFSGAVVAATPANVDAVVAGFLDQPGAYSAQVRSAQTVLSGFSPQAFEAVVTEALPSKCLVAA